MKRWGRELDHVVSVRFDRELLGSVRDLAKADDVSVSDWIRAAAAREAAGLTEVVLTAPEPIGFLNNVRVPTKLLRDAAEAQLERDAYRTRTFSCQHLTIGNAVAAECGQCGPMSAAA